MTFSLDDVHNIAERVFQFAHNQPQIAYQALVWVLLRRCQALRCGNGERVKMAARQDLSDVNGLCEALFAVDMKSGDVRTHSRMTGPQFSQCLATVCLTLHGDLADPTAGATHFHHHRDDPDWAQHIQAVALIGDYFFYKCDSAGPY